MATRKRLLQVALTELIEEVKKRNFMWDTDDPNYNDRLILAEAWSEIAAKMNKPEDILRSKWKNLRDLFKKEIKKTKVTSLDQYTGKWRFFDLLWFLYKPNDVDAYIEDTPLQTECVMKLEPEIDYREINDAESLEGKRRLSEEDNINVRKRVKYDEDSYDMLFLKSLLPYFEALDPIRRLIVRNKIQKILLDELTQIGEVNILGE